MADAGLTPSQEVQLLYEESEARSARAIEQLVSGNGFGELLARLTENTVSVLKLGSDAMDLVVRNLRIAGRQDVARLGRQLARTEDKLERVLQEVERLQNDLDSTPAPRPQGRARAVSDTGRVRAAAPPTSRVRRARRPGGKA